MKAMLGCLIVTLLAMPACARGPEVAGGLCWEDVPVLAASTFILASCAEEPDLVFRGDGYNVGCVQVHPSRIGKPITNDGGETGFTGARDLRGVLPEQAFLIEPSCGKKERVAVSDGPIVYNVDRLRSPYKP